MPEVSVPIAEGSYDPNTGWFSWNGQQIFLGAGNSFMPHTMVGVPYSVSAEGTALSTFGGGEFASNMPFIPTYTASQFPISQQSLPETRPLPVELPVASPVPVSGEGQIYGTDMPINFLEGPSAFSQGGSNDPLRLGNLLGDLGLGSLFGDFNLDSLFGDAGLGPLLGGNGSDPFGFLFGNASGQNQGDGNSILGGLLGGDLSSLLGGLFQSGLGGVETFQGLTSGNIGGAWDGFKDLLGGVF